MLVCVTILDIEKIKHNLLNLNLNLPLTNQVMFGAGAPCALHEIVASFPSNAVKFWGGFIITGDEAKRN